MNNGFINLRNERNEKNANYLSPIRKIGEIVKQTGGMNKLFYEYAEPHLSFLSKNLQIDQISAALFAALVNIFEGYDITINRCAAYLNIKCIEIIAFLDKLEILEEKELIQINRGDDYTLYSHNEILSFRLPINTLDALRSGTFYKLLHKKSDSSENFLLEIESLCEKRVQKRVSYKNTITKMKNLLGDNTHLDFVKKLLGLKLHDDDMMILLRFFHYTVNNDEPDMSIHHFEVLYDHRSQFTGLKRLLRSGNYILLKRNLIQNS